MLEGKAVPGRDCRHKGLAGLSISPRLVTAIGTELGFRPEKVVDTLSSVSAAAEALSMIAGRCRTAVETFAQRCDFELVGSRFRLSEAAGSYEKNNYRPSL